MSQELINRSIDLKRLRDEGFEVGIVGTKLLVSHIPYLNGTSALQYGTLVTALDVAVDQTARPESHIIHFIGEQPCRKDGSEIESIKHSVGDQDLGDGIFVNRSFSNKPSEGYGDYFEKVNRYHEIISAPAKSLFPEVTAQTFKIVETNENESVFQYFDTNSSRAEIDAISEKLMTRKVAIIGAGGTAAYVLDFVAKTPVAEIHIWDRDRFKQHNAFRAPGAPSKDELREEPTKVKYLSGIYSRMHRKIIIHEEFITEENMPSFDGFDVFICVDEGAVKKPLIELLESNRLLYFDVGMGVEKVDDTLIGTVRVTTGTPNLEKGISERGRISFQDRHGGDIYDSNIQIAELNALNAALAVIKWKKLIGFYKDVVGENNTLYTINDNLLHNDDHDS